MDEKQEKMIGGYPHVKVACAICKELIWVAKRREHDNNTCSDCGFHKSTRDTPGRSDKAVITDIRYNGEGGNIQ